MYTLTKTQNASQSDEAISSVFANLSNSAITNHCTSLTLFCGDIIGSKDCVSKFHK